MGFFKEEKNLKRVVVIVTPRWIKTLFFLIAMFISLLLFSAPILLFIADALLPSAFMSAALSPAAPLSLRTISSHLDGYDFRSSLIDVPIISIVRSAVILCVYSLCDGPRLSNGPYLGVATVCSAASLVFVSVKASYVFMSGGYGGYLGGGYARAMVAAMFVSSLGLAVGHVVVAYRTSCRERRKLLVYKIDIEAVSACKNGFPRYQKILQEARKNDKKIKVKFYLIHFPTEPGFRFIKRDLYSLMSDEKGLHRSRRLGVDTTFLCNVYA